jgi:hypothetical protein
VNETVAQTASLIEVLYTGYCVLGFAAFLVPLMLVANDWWRARLEPQHHPDRIVAREQIIVVGTLQVVQAVFILIGASAIITPPPAGGTGSISPLGASLAAGLPIAETLLLICALTMLYTRWRLRRETDKVMDVCADSTYDRCPYREVAVDRRERLAHRHPLESPDANTP